MNSKKADCIDDRIVNMGWGGVSGVRISIREEEEFKVGLYNLMTMISDYIN